MAGRVATRLKPKRTVEEVLSLSKHSPDGQVRMRIRLGVYVPGPSDEAVIWNGKPRMKLTGDVVYPFGTDLNLTVPDPDTAREIMIGVANFLADWPSGKLSADEKEVLRRYRAAMAAAAGR